MSLGLMMRHHALLAAAAKKGGGNFVRIGEHDYPYVKIGNLLWITENLYEFVPTHSKYNGKTEQEKYGLYYSWDGWSGNDYWKNAYDKGWRVPTKLDFDDLISGRVAADFVVGGSTGFNALLSGGFNQSGSLVGFGKYFTCWSSTNGDTVSSGSNYSFAVNPSTGLVTSSEFWNRRFSKISLRLCKDA